MSIEFAISRGDSEARLTPASRAFLIEHGVMGMDWLVDMRADIEGLYAEMSARTFPKTGGLK